MAKNFKTFPGLPSQCILLAMKFSTFLSDSRVDCPGTRRRPDLFVPGGCRSESHQRYCKPEHYFRWPFKLYSHWGGWTHGSEPHLLKSYRGSFSLFAPLLTSMSTYASCKAPRFGQAIHPILVYVFHRKVNQWLESSRAGVFRRQWRYSQSFSKARRFSLASLQSGPRGIGRRRFCGTRHSILMPSTIMSHSRHQQYTQRYSTNRNGVHYILPRRV
jgi:hypothetical protein